MPETTEQQPANTKPKQSAYLVCEGAQCKCLGGGDIRAKLKVDSHKKAYINNNKLLATVKDITFEEGPKPFTSCSLATSQDKSCTPKFEKWQKPYKDIEVEGNQVITDQSELMCLTWKGIVSIDTHGQKQDVSAAQANNIDRNMAMQVNPLADFVPLNLDVTKKVEVKSISGALIDDPKYKSVTNQQIAVVKSEKKDDPVDMYVRPAQEVEFKSTYTGEASLVCWKIAGAKGSMHFLQHGPVYKTSLLEAGKYTIEGYGTGGDNNLDIDTKIAKNKDTGKSEFIKRNPDRSCRLDILVQVNKLTGIRHVSSDNVVAGKVDDKAGVHVRIGVPVTFEPVYLMPPNQEEVDHLILLIKDASGNEVQRAKGKPNIIFAAQNSAAVYSVEAYFDNSDAKPFIYPFKTAANTISVIAASGLKKENDKIRPGTTLTFSVSQFKFENDEVQEELIQAELANIKWYDNADTPAATGTTTYSNIYQREEKYVVTCAVTTKSAGWFTTKKNEADDWHFEVTRNYPTAIEQKTEGKVKVGKKVVFEMKSIFDVIYADEKTIHWELSGPESTTLVRLNVFVFTPKQKGKYILKVTMNGKTKEFSFECIACEIVQGWWTDGDGNILTGNNAYNEPNNTIGFAGWGQEVVATFKHVGLKGEEVTLEVWDSDLTSNTSVFTKDIKIEDDYSVGCAITLDEKIKTKVKEKGFSSDGTLYFTVKAKNGLNIINSGMSLPENGKFLNVDSTPRVRAYFSDNNDTRRYSTAALDTPVYMQIKSTNMIGEELEIELWSLNSSLSPLASRFTFSVDKYGMASLKLNMKAIEPKLPTDKDSIMIYLAIYHKKTGHRYFTGSDKPKLTMYRRLPSSPASIGTTKAFVVVDMGNSSYGSCGKKYCIKKGDKSELIREINIRLAGFGGNVPTDEFTIRTENMIKQFQRDYMQVAETGKICGSVLKAIDKFSSTWVENISEYTCLCNEESSIDNKCSGFGKGLYKGEYTISKSEKYHKYEHPGMHRSLLWGVSAARFYLSLQKTYSYLNKSAGYRCWEHNIFAGRATTNHMGKAVDLQFRKNNINITGPKKENISILQEIRDLFFTRYLNSKYNWVCGQDNFGLEPFGLESGHTWSWIHLDVREFDAIYLDDLYFVKKQNEVIGKGIIDIANDCGFSNTCDCVEIGGRIVKESNRIEPKFLKTSEKAKRFILDWELYDGNLYNDDSSEHHCTIGYGHLVHNGPCNGSESEEFKKGITETRAIELFNLDLVKFENAVKRDITVNLYQNEFDALVSLLFNCGENYLKNNEAPKLYRNLLDKKYAEAAKEFLDITNGELKGLVKRRKAENEIFINNIYNSKH